MGREADLCSGATLSLGESEKRSIEGEGDGCGGKMKPEIGPVEGVALVRAVPTELTESSLTSSVSSLGAGCLPFDLVELSCVAKSALPLIGLASSSSFAAFIRRYSSSQS